VHQSRIVEKWSTWLEEILFLIRLGLQYVSPNLLGGELQAWMKNEMATYMTTIDFWKSSSLFLKLSFLCGLVRPTWPPKNSNFIYYLFIKTRVCQPCDWGFFYISNSISWLSTSSFLLSSLLSVKLSDRLQFLEDFFAWCFRDNQSRLLIALFFCLFVFFNIPLVADLLQITMSWPKLLMAYILLLSFCLLQHRTACLH